MWLMLYKPLGGCWKGTNKQWSVSRPMLMLAWPQFNWQDAEIHLRNSNVSVSSKNIYQLTKTNIDLKWINKTQLEILIFGGKQIVKFKSRMNCGPKMEEFQFARIYKASLFGNIFNFECRTFFSYILPHVLYSIPDLYRPFKVVTET